jgi:diacylglycerol kinase family enzyme
MASTPRIALIANPVSGRGRGAQMLKSLQAELLTRGVHATAFTTRKAGDARLHAQQVEADIVVAIGGDGTLSEVLDGAAGRLKAERSSPRHRGLGARAACIHAQSAARRE